MGTDKPLSIRLLNAFEYYYRENAALRTILKGRRIPGWEKELERLVSDEEVSGLVRDQFAGVRSALTEEGSEEQALQRLLAIFPPNKDDN
jgi:hypothetical protein